ncbi:MAG: hypothetical protein O2894_03350 [Planctomycetota bacterium]|nr:hypothetical protein [Planctomycetota bacterium]
MLRFREVAWLRARPRVLSLALAALTALLMGALLASGASASPTLVVRTHTESYDGRYRDHPAFEDAFGDLETQVGRALTKIHERLGLKPKASGRIHVHVRDADPRRFGHDRARCTTRRVEGQDYQHVDLYAEYFVSGDADVETVLTHELVHAVMRDRMSRSAYERLPPWLREGLAVHVADEGERHLHRTLLACERVESLLTGLSSGARSVLTYPYAGLAIDCLVARAGPDALPRLAAALVAGTAPTRAVEDVAGVSFAAFRTEVDAFARERIEAAAAGLDEIQRARRLFRLRKHALARTACDAFLACYPDSAFAPTARYVNARCWYRDGRLAEAEAGFRDCLAKDAGRSGWVDECHLYLGLACLEQGRAADARATLSDYLDFHPYATQRDLGWLALGRALRALGRDSDARSAFTNVNAMEGARGAHRAAAERELAEERE